MPPPCSNMPGSTACTRTSWATTLAASFDSIWSMVSSCTPTMLPGPVSTALLTRRSTPPHSAITWSAAPRSARWSWRSATSSNDLRPDSRIWAAVSWRLPGSARPPPVSESSRPSPTRRVRPVMATSHPAAARARAVAFPMPREAPVTIARLGMCSADILRCLSEVRFPAVVPNLRTIRFGRFDRGMIARWAVEGS